MEVSSIMTRIHFFLLGRKRVIRSRIAIRAQKAHRTSMISN